MIRFKNDDLVACGTEISRETTLGRLILFKVQIDEKATTESLGQYLLPIGILNFNFGVRSIAQLNSFLVVSEGRNFNVIEISSSCEMKIIASYPVRNTIVKLVVKDDYIFIADHKDGILIFRFDESTNRIANVHCDSFVRLMCDVELVNNILFGCDKMGNIFAFDNWKLQTMPKTTHKFNINDIAIRLSSTEVALDRDIFGAMTDETTMLVVRAGTLLGNLISILILPDTISTILKLIQNEMKSISQFDPLESFSMELNCIDGDFLSQYLDASKEIRVAVSEKCNQNSEFIEFLLKSLNKLTFS